MRRASERKVKIKIAAPLAGKEQEIALISKFAEVKNTAQKGRFVIVDGKELTFMVMDDEKAHPNYDFGVWVRSDMFCKVLKGFFDETWKTLK